MAQTIFIRLPGDASTVSTEDLQVEWCVSDGIGRPTVQKEKLSAVLQTVAGRDVVVLVPGQEVVLTEVDLQIRQRAKLLQAAPYALEEQLAEDVEKLHFAVGEKQPDGSTPVLVVSRLNMEAWLAPFTDVGITPKACVPDVLCLPAPANEKDWSILIEGAFTLVRSGAYKGFACETEALADYLSLADDSSELNLNIATTSSTGLPELKVNRIDENASLKYGLEGLSLSKFAGMNLLQGRYADQQSHQGWWRPFLFTACLALLWLVLATGGHAVNYYKINSEFNELERANQATMARLFPEIKTLVPGNEKIQLQRRLSELQGQGDQNSFYRSLSALAGGLEKVGGLELQELQLREGAIFINLTAKDISTLERLKAHYEKQSMWQLDVQSANASSDGVQIRASLKGNN